MKTVCWNGCSFTAGEGVSVQQAFCCLTDQHCGFVSDNIAVCGSSNYQIFMRSAQALIKNKYDILFVQWTALNRLWLYPGPDSKFFVNDSADTDFVYKNIYISKRNKQQLKDQLLILNHDYHNIKDLIRYCNILEKLAASTDTQLVFMNGLIPWTRDLVQDVDRFDLSSSLSSYTKSMLDFDQRDDKEIINFFTELQQDFASLNQSLWVNTFDSMYERMVDVGSDGYHPGAKTHQWMYNSILTHLEA